MHDRRGRHRPQQWQWEEARRRKGERKKRTKRREQKRREVGQISADAKPERKGKEEEIKFCLIFATAMARERAKIAVRHVNTQGPSFPSPLLHLRKLFGYFCTKIEMSTTCFSPILCPTLLQTILGQAFLEKTFDLTRCVTLFPLLLYPALPCCATCTTPAFAEHAASKSWAKMGRKEGGKRRMWIKGKKTQPSAQSCHSEQNNNTAIMVFCQRFLILKSKILKLQEGRRNYYGIMSLNVRSVQHVH